MDIEYTREDILDFCREFMPVEYNDNSKKTWHVKNSADSDSFSIYMWALITEQYDVFLDTWIKARGDRCGPRMREILLERPLEDVPLYLGYTCEKCPLPITVPESNLYANYGCSVDLCAAIAAWRMRLGK